MIQKSARFRVLILRPVFHFAATETMEHFPRSLFSASPLCPPDHVDAPEGAARLHFYRQKTMVVNHLHSCRQNAVAVDRFDHPRHCLAAVVPDAVVLEARHHPVGLEAAVHPVTGSEVVRRPQMEVAVERRFHLHRHSRREWNFPRLEAQGSCFPDFLVPGRQHWRPDSPVALFHILIRQYRLAQE